MYKIIRDKENYKLRVKMGYNGNPIWRTIYKSSDKQEVENYIKEHKVELEMLDRLAEISGVKDK